MNSTKALNDLQNIMDMQEAYNAFIAPYRDRLYAFLYDNKETVAISDIARFDFLGQKRYDAEKMADFTVVLDPRRPNELFFSQPVDEYNGIEWVHFNMPLSYLDDPDAWEENVLNEGISLRVDISEAYFAEVPEMRGLVSMSILRFEADHLNVFVYSNAHGQNAAPLPELVFNRFHFVPGTRKITNKLLA